MSKRTATTDLNHENWNQEDDEPETPGVFRKATEEALKTRQIRTARRRVMAPAIIDSKEGNNQVETKSVFAGFSGFKKAEPASTKGLFSFLATPSNGSESKADTGSAPSKSDTSTNRNPENDRKLNGGESGTDSAAKSSDKEYYRKLKGLNESVSKWISSHVASNPLIILTPIFRDYERHLASIQIKDNSKENEDQSTSEISKDSIKTDKVDPSSSDAVQKSSAAALVLSEDKSEEKKVFGTSIFGSSSNSMSTSTSSAKTSFSFGSGGASQGQSQFCFGSPTSSNSSASTVTFSFGSSNTTSPSAGFSFGSGAPFKFSNVASTTSGDKKDEEEEADEDTPPVPDHKPVNEEGSTYTKRCKVFVKQGKDYSDRGIGNLFLKPVGEKKTQLIVRADTSLGNVLLNFLVNSSLPMQRLGTKDVAIVCIPTPDSQPPPVTVLIRVKTSDDADELLNTLEKHKNESS